MKYSEEQISKIDRTAMKFTTKRPRPHLRRTDLIIFSSIGGQIQEST